MATLWTTATAYPPYRYELDDVQQALPLWLDQHPRLTALAARVFANAAVHTRYGCRPLLDLARQLSLTESSRLYQEYARQLGETVIRQCLHRARIEAAAVDLIITTSCTGFMIPSLDAYVANSLGLSPHIKRLPITELGCAAGAVALARAADYLQAFPQHTVLVLAVELPSLTFQFHDISPANIVSSALFGDGAAAVLLREEAPSGGPRIIATQSTLFPHTTELMGFDLKDGGLHIVLSADIPEVVCAEVPRLVGDFLRQQGLALHNVQHFLLHPGGRRVLDGLTECLQLPPAVTTISREVLRDYGNLSSAAVLCVLDRFLATARPQDGDLGLLLAFGPGFSAETVLLQWGGDAKPRS